MWEQVGKLHAYHGEVPVEVRLLKLTEEVGEVADAFLGVHGLDERVATGARTAASARSWTSAPAARTSPSRS